MHFSAASVTINVQTSRLCSFASSPGRNILFHGGGNGGVKTSEDRHDTISPLSRLSLTGGVQHRLLSRRDKFLLLLLLSLSFPILWERWRSSCRHRSSVVHVIDSQRATHSRAHGPSAKRIQASEFSSGWGTSETFHCTIFRGNRNLFISHSFAFVSVHNGIDVRLLASFCAQRSSFILRRESKSI